MKTKYLAFSVLIAAALLLSSCDMMRSLAGRPTSADIIAKQALIEKHEQALLEEKASIEAARKREADSVAAREAIFSLDIVRRRADSVSSLKNLSVGSTYSLIMGTFSQKDNAERLGARIAAGGYSYKVITFRNGFCVVAACPSDDPVEFYSSVESLRKEPYCSRDAWILIDEQ